MLTLLVAATMQTALAVPNPRVLVFSKTTGFRHDNIPSAIEAIKKLGQEHNFTVDATEDAKVFTDQNLNKYDLVCFASTTGDILDDSQQKALENFVEGGKGWMGIHSASDTEYDWPWYAELVGAYFKSHPPGGQHVRVNIENRGNPSTSSLPRFWVRPDEWYDWRANPRSKVQVLASIDEGFYRSEPQDHPIAWCHWQGRGRAWYTEMGHFKEAYSEKFYLEHLYGGLMWAAQGNAQPAGAKALGVNKSVGWEGGFNGKPTYVHFNFKLANDASGIRVTFGDRCEIVLYGGSAGGKVTDGSGFTNAITNAYAGDNIQNVFDGIVQKLPNGNYLLADVRLNGVVIHRNLEVAPSAKVVGTAGKLNVVSLGNVITTEAWMKN